jgi:hypothetical protein
MHYFDSLHFGHLNVCPIISYLGISPFDNKDIASDPSILLEMRDRRLFYKKYYFEPFIDLTIDSLFRNNKKYDRYVIFSKPVRNTLLLEVRNGHYNLRNIRQPYFGSAEKYLFVFDDKNNVINCFKDTISYN